MWLYSEKLKCMGTKPKIQYHHYYHKLCVSKDHVCVCVICSSEFIYADLSIKSKMTFFSHREKCLQYECATVDRDSWICSNIFVFVHCFGRFVFLSFFFFLGEWLSFVTLNCLNLYIAAREPDIGDQIWDIFYWPNWLIFRRWIDIWFEDVTFFLWFECVFIWVHKVTRFMKRESIYCRTISADKSVCQLRVHEPDASVWGVIVYNSIIPFCQRLIRDSMICMQL